MISIFNIYISFHTKLDTPNIISRLKYFSATKERKKSNLKFHVEKLNEEGFVLCDSSYRNIYKIKGIFKSNENINIVNVKIKPSGFAVIPYYFSLGIFIIVTLVSLKQLSSGEFDIYIFLFGFFAYFFGIVSALVYFSPESTKAKKDLARVFNAIAVKKIQKKEFKL